MNTKELKGLTITYFVDPENSKVDGRRLTLFEELQEQVIQITRVVVGKEADDDIDIPGKLALYSESAQRIDQRMVSKAELLQAWPHNEPRAYRGIVPIVFSLAILLASLPCK